ncbi:hypothetical protein P8452_09731 [Trifolium repens]|nr:hypothetical protein P8452_09731 [Trifolium repens]
MKGHSRFVRLGDLDEANKKRLCSLGLPQASSLPPPINYPVQNIQKRTKMTLMICCKSFVHNHGSNLTRKVYVA